MDILLNGMLVDELSTIVHISRLEFTARRLTEKLKEMIPRQMVQVKYALSTLLFLIEYLSRMEYEEMKEKCMSWRLTLARLVSDWCRN